MYDTTPITKLWNDIVITYDENSNKWLCTIRGIERSYDTLENAKKAINSPPPPDKKPFAPVVCYREINGGIEKVTAKSIAARGRYDYQDYVWITDKDGSRSKMAVSHLYPVGQGENDGNVQMMMETFQQARDLHNQGQDIRKKLEALKIADHTEKAEA